MSATPDTDAAKRKAGEAKRDRIDLTIDLALGAIVTALCVLAVLFACSIFVGCSTYKGGVVTDGTNLAIGMKLPGTEWNINVLDYIGGVRVAANEGCILTVTNEVAETNSYFGVVETRRHTRMSAAIEPTDMDGEGR